MEQSGGERAGRGGLRLCWEPCPPRGPHLGGAGGLTLLHVQAAGPGLAPSDANRQQALLHVCGEGGPCSRSSTRGPSPKPLGHPPCHQCPLGVWGRDIWTQIQLPIPAPQTAQGPAALPPPGRTLPAPCPQLTPEEGRVPPRVAPRQGHLVLCLAQDGGEDASEGPGAILRGGEWGSGGEGSALGTPPLPSQDPTLYLVLKVVLAQVAGLGGTAVPVGQSSLPRTETRHTLRASWGSTPHSSPRSLPGQPPCSPTHQAFQPLGDNGGEPALTSQL